MKQSNLRTVERLVNKEWKSCHMKFLRIDDVFRIFESDGTPVHDGKMWVVLNKPYFFVGEWGVSCEPIIGVIQT